MEILEIRPGEEQLLRPWLEQPLYRGFQGERLGDDGAGVHLLAVEGDKALARCSIWLRGTPEENGAPLGAIGHFAALDEAGAQAVLGRGEELLRQAGRKAVLAPMDGNTWRKYRFITWSSEEPPFLLEPENPRSYPGWLESVGYLPCARYLSTREESLQVDEAGLEGLLKELGQRDIVVEAADLTRFEELLDHIYRISCVCFRENPFYTHLPEERFKAQYRALRDYVMPQLVFVAKKAGETVGFFFALPDYSQKQRGAAVDTVIFKTIAVLPDFRRHKIGSVFFALARRAALDMGLVCGINALMYQDNPSTLVCRTDKVIRRYTLYKKEL